ncbi:MAG: DUF4355 domain-containing protein [Oscillospiraceae bacterium]|nr:DUF4355 domain-containing protein [Oscillospiraceae bacterium]
MADKKLGVSGDDVVQDDVVQDDVVQDGPDQGHEEARYSDADVDRLINRKFAEWQKKQQKAVDEAKRLAEMNAQQKAEFERDELQKELDVLRGERTRSNLTNQARKMLSEADVVAPDELLGLLVGEDADSTKAAVDSFCSLFKGEVKRAVAAALKGGVPKTGAGSGGVSKDDILKVTDRSERQRLINENMDLFL